ncbi:MAG: hypothetical protein HWQ38_34340 [Nostoc sp. NMS7]|uniref:hypothetical protein n=1 Tax=Nostoc sp. NMS7 TaxID=2815391 RepID=UPI0025DC11C4|nr:hypothetical protein [Nostoc sp. NMS7]MBN3951281.1 hypothetical protein [Nostoc sp. NMS7]
MNKRSHIHNKADSSASNPVQSQFQSHSCIVQAQPQSSKHLTQTETEDQELQQQKLEVTKLELQAKNATITPEGNARGTGTAHCIASKNEWFVAEETGICVSL